MALRTAVSANAERFAKELAPVIATVRADGITSLRGIAVELNTHGIRTRRGGVSQVSNVRNLVATINFFWVVR